MGSEGKRKVKKSGKRENNYFSTNFHTQKNGITLEGILFSAQER